MHGRDVVGYDLDENNGNPSVRSLRYLAQRCELHFGTDTPDYVEPEWEPFDATATAETC